MRSLILIPIRLKISTINTKEIAKNLLKSSTNLKIRPKTQKISECEKYKNRQKPAKKESNYHGCVTVSSLMMGKMTKSFSYAS